jgi:tripartite-type tricarboxylate transporter receptor subunit TctC
VTIIVPFPPGISTDILARAVGAALSDKFGQPFVVENRPGASGNVGGLAAAKSAPDGYTLFLGTLGPTVTNKFVYKNIGYDPDRAFAPIIMMGASPLIIVGSPKLPAKNLAELIELAKKNPGKLNAGTVGVGSQAHIVLEMINKLAGTSIVHVPYRIATQALPDLISGDLQVGFNYIPTFVPNVQQGDIRGLAVTTLARVNDLPNVPTVDESGLRGFEASGWNALFAPAGTPPEIVKVLNDALREILADSEVKTKLIELGIEARASTPEDISERLKADIEKWGKVIDKAGIQKQ